MSITTGFTTGISPTQFGNGLNVSIPNFDMEDTTFSDLLEKQIGKVGEVKNVQPYENPAFMNIEELILDNNQHSKIQEMENTELGDFLRKSAANAYNKYSKSVVTDLAEFVDDIRGLLK